MSESKHIKSHWSDSSLYERTLKQASPSCFACVLQEKQLPLEHEACWVCPYGLPSHRAFGSDLLHRPLLSSLKYQSSLDHFAHHQSIFTSQDIQRHQHRRLKEPISVWDLGRTFWGISLWKSILSLHQSSEQRLSQFWWVTSIEGPQIHIFCNRDQGRPLLHQSSRISWSTCWTIVHQQSSWGLGSMYQVVSQTLWCIPNLLQWERPLAYHARTRTIFQACFSCLLPSTAFTLFERRCEDCILQSLSLSQWLQVLTVFVCSVLLLRYQGKFEWRNWIMDRYINEESWGTQCFELGFEDY